MPGAAVPRFDSVTIDCPDPAALARFYGELLEWPVPAPAGDAEYVAIDPPGGGTAINFQRAPGFVAPDWPDPAVQQQVHFDLAVDDLEAAHERAIALGARLLDTQAKFRVYSRPGRPPLLPLLLVSREVRRLRRALHGRGTEGAGGQPREQRDDRGPPRRRTRPGRAGSSCDARAMVQIGSVVLNVTDIRRAAAFWRGALGYVPRAGGHLGALVPQSGEGPALLLDETDMTHLDLHVGSEQEQQAEVERLVALGAQHVDWEYPEGASFVVLSDPEGNLFCVVNTEGGQRA